MNDFNREVRNLGEHKKKLKLYFQIYDLKLKKIIFNFIILKKFLNIEITS